MDSTCQEEPGIASDGPAVRRAGEGDLSRVLDVVESARALLASDGIDQWQNGNPCRADFEGDISRGWGRVLVDDGEVVGYAALMDLPDPNYAEPLSGAWRARPDVGGATAGDGAAAGRGAAAGDDAGHAAEAAARYATIHRVALAPGHRGRGLAQVLIGSLVREALAAGFAEVRIDTHPDNARMRHVVGRVGFGESCVVAMGGDVTDVRVAYQLFG